MPRVIIIAGPNGAGKKTFAIEYLPNEGDCIRYVNADLIAQQIYKPLVNEWRIYDNSGAVPQLIDSGGKP